MGTALNRRRELQVWCTASAPLKPLHRYSAPRPKAGLRTWEEATLPHDTRSMEVDADEVASEEVVDLEEGMVEAEDIGREDEDVVMEEDNKSKRKPP